MDRLEIQIEQVFRDPGLRPLPRVGQQVVGQRLSVGAASGLCNPLGGGTELRSKRCMALFLKQSGGSPSLSPKNRRF